MSEDSQVILTTTDDIERLEKLIVGNSIRSMKIALKKYERRMIVFQSRLVELYRNEKIIKARIYNNASMLKIYRDYIAGKNKRNIPTQSFESVVIAQKPHHSMSYDKDNIMTTVEGIRKIDAEINRINTEIKSLQTDLNLYKKGYKKLKKRLDDAEKKKNERSKLGRFFEVTREDLIADEIAQARTANILLLLGINENFRNLTTPLEELSAKDLDDFISEFDKKGINRYPDGDRRAIHQLQVYQQLFWAHGHTKGLTGTRIASETGERDEVVPLSTLLNFDNPGDTKNTEVLNLTLETVRGGATNVNKMSLTVDRYIRDVESVIADPLISKGVEIRPDITAPLSESMRAETLSYPTSVLRIGDYYLGSFELPSLIGAIRKNWKKRNARLYFGLPACPNAKPSGTTTDIKEEEAKVFTDEKTKVAQDLYIEKMKDAQAYVKEQVEISLGDLPLVDDPPNTAAPEWVRIYVKRYEKAARGVIVYQGDRVTILRGTSKESTEMALFKVNKMTTFPSPPPDKPEEKMEEKDQYTYESLTEYHVKVGTNNEYRVSIEEMAAIDAGEVPTRIKEKNTKIIKAATTRTKVKEFVAYVMWGQVGGNNL